MNVGDRIKKRRLELGMTQEELSIKAGYKSRSSINKIENSRDLPLPKVQEVARILDCSPSYLLGWEDANSIIETAKTDVELSLMEDRLKAYALKLAKLPKDKQVQIMSLIDMLEDK
jgi:transcriptional regulator with XRE-family HTH domain